MNRETNTDPKLFNPSKANGVKNQFNGAIKKVAGNVTDDESLRAEGEADSFKGEAEVKASKLKDKAKGAVKAAGDLIEKAGDKLALKGHTKVGMKVRNLGDKLEHSLD